MNIKKHKSLIILFLIFLFSVVFRLFFTLKTQYFDMYSYDSFRQIISITETGFPLIVDSLSFGGRVLISSPVYYYIIAGFSFVFGKVFALKVLPAIFISLTTFLVYLLAKRLTDNENVSLLAAFFSAFFPALFIETFNSLSPINLVIPVILGCSYLFINLRKSDNPYGYVFLLFLLALLSPLSTIFVLGIVIFLIIIKLEYKKVLRKDFELGLFSIFLVLWVQAILYKKAFLFHGFNVIWQNIPPSLVSNYFYNFQVSEALYSIGLIPLFFGIFALYKYTLNEKNRSVYFIVALTFALGVLLWMNLIKLSEGVIFFGVLLIILSSLSFNSLFTYFSKTKISSTDFVIWISLIILFISMSIPFAISNAEFSLSKTPTSDEIVALEWLSEQAGNNTVLASVDEGFLISAIGKSKNVADTNFLLISDAEVIVADINTMYSAKFKSVALEYLDRYSVDYIYLSPKTKLIQGVETISYINDTCFPLVYSSSVQIYEVRCSLSG